MFTNGSDLKSEHAILDVLFPKVRAELLRLLFRPPQKPRYVRELMNMSGLALCTIQDELRKLTAVGILRTWSNGYHRFYRANRDHPLFPELLRMVQISPHLPRTKHSALHRQRRSRNRKRRQNAKLARLSIDRPIRWDLFSRPKRT
jgi:predicted transcriptional regulator